jgi:hypothetical protein
MTLGEFLKKQKQPKFVFFPKQSENRVVPKYDASHQHNINLTSRQENG